MRVKTYIEFKGRFRLIYIGKIGKNGVFKFRNKQLRKASYKQLKTTFHYECLGGTLTIPNLNSDMSKYHIKMDNAVYAYQSVVPKKENSKYIVTYWK
jgi:hypothetical protein